MRKATLTRNETSDEGTFGTLLTDDGFTCRTVELPWEKNAQGKSCIPTGKYLFRVTDSPKHGKCYEEWDDPATPRKEDVPGRDHIQIHSANWAGDKSKGFFSQLLGCIALGTTVETMKTPEGKMQKGVTNSKATIAAFMAHMRGETFELTIV